MYGGVVPPESLGVRPKVATPEERTVMCARIALRTLVTLTLVAAALPLAGCHGMRSTPERLALRGERAVVRVAGHGTVVSEPLGIACGPAGESDAACKGAWMDVGTPTLTAKAAPGWAFDHWEWSALDGALSGGTAATHEYRAVFKPVGTAVASASGTAKQ
jgi:hypothetical protein